MASISDMAKEYEPATIGNIADLEVVNTTVEIRPETFKEGQQDEFTINVIEVEGVLYRVPNGVLANLKAILEEKPDLKFFKVRKDGSGMNTRYTVIPIE